MTKCSDFKSQRKRIQAEILIASPSRNTENFNGIWTEPQKNDPDTRTNSQGQKQGEQGLKARKTQGRSRAPWVPWSKEQLELEVGRSTGVKSQEILQEGDSLSGPALESWGSCMGQGGNALGNHREAHTEEAAVGLWTDAFPGPRHEKRWKIGNTVIQKASSVEGYSESRYFNALSKVVSPPQKVLSITLPFLLTGLQESFQQSSQTLDLSSRNQCSLSVSVPSSTKPESTACPEALLSSLVLTQSR